MPAFPIPNSASFAESNDCHNPGGSPAGGVFGDPIEIRDNDRTYTMEEAVKLLNARSPEVNGRIGNTGHKQLLVTSRVG